MSRTKVFLTGLISAVPVACGMIACASAFPTAFEIRFSLVPLILFCIAASLLLSFWMTVPKYGFGFGALYLAGMILLVVFCADRIADGARAFLYRALNMLPEGISAYFDLNYLAAATEEMADPDLYISLLLMTVTGAAGILLAYSLLRSKVAALPLLIPLPMILLSFAYTNQPPAAWTVILLCIYYGCALFGNGFKKGASPDRLPFLAVLLPTILVLCAALVWILPKEEDFTPIPEEARQKLFSDLFGGVRDTVLEQIGNTSPQEIRLEAERNRKNANDVAFYVRSDHAGTYHLRLRSYGAYSDGSWLAADEYRGDWHALEALGNRQQRANARMEIRDYNSDERIVPYAFFADGVETEETRIKAKGLTQYAWRYTVNYRIDPLPLTDAEREYYRFACEQYTMPDGKEKQVLLMLAENAGIHPPADPQNDVYAVYETALQVADYVRGDRRYTLDPGKTPDGQDFILYFLTQGNEGYCVHFASATTAILQSLGIPARYTSGFYVRNVGSGWREVPESSRHAWAEVYLCGVGWIPIESTQSFPPNAPLSAMETEAPSQFPALPTPKLPTSAPASRTPGSNGQEPVTPSPVPATPEPQTPQTSPDASKQPGASKDPDAPQDADESKRGARWLLLLIPAVPALWVGACLLVRNRREARFADPNVRRSIPEMAYYLKRLERYGIGKDPDAERWAVEAVFSDHEMRAERKELRKRVHAAQKAVYRDKPFRRFLLRWILFVL